MRRRLMIALGAVLLFATAAYAYVGATREPVVFYEGHTHHDGETQGAPSHSGGLDRNGCHNASVPYHCH